MFAIQMPAQPGAPPSPPIFIAAPPAAKPPKAGAMPPMAQPVSPFDPIKTPFDPSLNLMNLNAVGSIDWGKSGIMLDPLTGKTMNGGKAPKMALINPATGLPYTAPVNPITGQPLINPATGKPFKAPKNPA